MKKLIISLILLPTLALAGPDLSQNDGELRGLAKIASQQFVTGATNATAITASASMIVVTSTAGAVTLATMPNISTGTSVQNGTYIVITSTSAGSDSVCFQDDDTLAGSSLELGAVVRCVGRADSLVLMYLSSLQKWVERSFSSND